MATRAGRTTTAAGGAREWLLRLLGRPVPTPVGPATLADLAPGRRGRVVALDHGSPVAERLAHLGLLEGVELEVLRRAPTGDPIEVRATGFALSLRRDEARALLVEASG